MPEHYLVILAAVGFEVGLGVAAIAVGWLLGIHPLAQLIATPAALLWGVAAAAPPVVLLVVTDQWGTAVTQQIRREAQRLIAPVFRGANLWDLAAVAIAAGWGEELLFRGLIQYGVSGLAGPLFGIVAASLLFGLVHPVSRSYVALAAAMGVYLGVVYLASDNLLPAIVAHALYDFIALIYLLRLNTTYPLLDSDDEASANARTD